MQAQNSARWLHTAAGAHTKPGPGTGNWNMIVTWRRSVGV